MLLLSLLGAMVGAPLVARECEQRTTLLVWLQSITRTRWLSVKVALVVGTGLLVGGALLGELSWWYHPFAQLLSPLNPLAFDFAGPVLVASTVMAFGLGMFAGTLTRRTVLAIFLTFALLLAIRRARRVWAPSQLRASGHDHLAPCSSGSGTDDRGEPGLDPGRRLH